MTPPTTDNEEEQPEQQPEEVHVEEKYSGSDIAIAKVFAPKTRRATSIYFTEVKKTRTER